MWNGFCPFWNNGAFGAWGWAGLALNLILWAALIVGLVYLVTRIVRRSGINNQGFGAVNGPASAVRIAQERYARGEIGRDEYMNLMEDLR